MELIKTEVETDVELDLDPMFDRIFIRRHVVKEVGRLILPEGAKQMTHDLSEGTVVSVGIDVANIKPDDVIIFGKYAGAEMVRNGGTFIVLNEGDVIAKVKGVKSD